MNIVKKLTGGAANALRSGYVKFGSAVAGVSLVTGSAFAVDEPAAIDLGPVTTGITNMQVAILAAVSSIITLALTLSAIKFGGKWLLGLFSTFAKKG